MPTEPANGNGGPARTIAALAVGAAAGIFAFTIVAGVTGSVLAAVPVGALLAAGAVLVARRRLPDTVAQAARWRPLAVLSLLATVLALVQLGRLAGFMVAPERTGLSMQPWSAWQTEHSCLSAYYVAGQASAAGANVYDENVYYSSPGTRERVGEFRRLGAFKVDMFEYPPPFLLLPRALDVVAPGFLRLRMIWFGLEGAAVLLGFLMVGSSLGGVAAGRALLLAPLPWAAIPTLDTLQMGNVQLPVIALSVVAMLLLERGRFAAGGGLLAFVTLSKLFPGLLLLQLAAGRRWRALAWTAGMTAALLLATLVLVGREPFRSFMDHLPRLLSGEAFPGLKRPQAVAVNHSIPGLVFKLKQLGVWNLSFGAASVVGWIATAAGVAVAVALGRRPLSPEVRPIAWLAVLIVGTLRSPFLPQQYSVFPALWLLTLLAATTVLTPRQLAVVILAWAALNIIVPIDATVSLERRVLLAAIPQIVLLALTAIGIRVALRSVREQSPGSAIPSPWPAQSSVRPKT